jgi:hypothetical protein
MMVEDLLTNTALNSWKQVMARLDKGIDAMSDEQLQKQVSPGRNRLQYIVGHLVAVHDRMFTMLGVGERMYPQLDEAYLLNPDGKLADPVSGADLKKAWTEVNVRLTKAFEALTAAQWLERHTSVSEEDFAKDPSRNRLAVLLSRTNHASFHAGQIVLAR